MPFVRPMNLRPSEGLPLNDHVIDKPSGTRFPDVSRLPEPLLVGFVGGVVAAESFGFASGATYRQHILPGLLAGVAAALGMYLLSRWPWKLPRNRRLAGFVMVLLFWLMAWVAGIILAPSVVYRLAFEADPPPAVQLVRGDRRLGMTGPSLLVLKTDRSSLDALLTAGQFTPLSDAERIPAHLTAYLSPEMRAGQFRLMLGDARIFADQLPTGADVVVVQRTIAGAWDTFWEPRLVRVMWDPKTSLAHVLVSYPDARDTDD